ncbi:MAG: heme o synthase [Acidobacteriota bacterium]
MKSHSAVGAKGDAGWLHAYFELTKPRVSTLVLLTTAAGFYLASPPPLNWFLLLETLMGTALVAGGTAVLNQFMERENDGRMRRTSGRPLPSGRLEPRNAMVFGLVLIAGGVTFLGLAVNLLTALLGSLTALVYLLVYTPLKTRTTLCTTAGAFPGAMPPLMGWAGARGELDLQALLLFGILFLWQFPHFLAISWIYREDYQRGGFKMLPVVDQDGRKTGSRVVASTLILLILSVVASLAGLFGWIYLVGALLMGAMFLWSGIRLAVSRTRSRASRLLRASVLYLSALLILMMLDKV